MKINTILLVLVANLMFSCSRTEDSAALEEVVTIHTKFGNMVAILFDDTPKHKENFLEIVKMGKYDSTTFHRVINELSIEGGNIAPTLLKSTAKLASEIIPNHFHQKGAISAVRAPNSVNPNKQSHNCQFFITHGAPYTKTQLQSLENSRNAKILSKPLLSALSSKKYPKLNARMDSLKHYLSPRELNQQILNFRDDLHKIYGPIETFNYTLTQKERYTKIGGRPDMDGQYTVFGQIISGLAIIDSIANQELDRFGAPIQKIYISMSITKTSKEEVTKKYNYRYK